MSANAGQKRGVDIKQARAKKEREIAKLKREMAHACNEMREEIKALENSTNE